MDIAETLRREVRRIVPDSVERVRPGWGIVGLDIPVGRRLVYYGFVWPEMAHAHLGFQHGILMHDPSAMLQGRGVTKRVRWLTFGHVREVRGPVIRPLLLEAVRIATMTSGQRMALALERL